MSGIVEQLVHAAGYMAKKNLVWGNSGNISARDKNELWITGSGTMISEIKEKEFVKCFVSGKHDASERKPSKELPMHQAVYQERPDIQCVLHASPFFSTLVACSEIMLESNLFVESMYYLYDIEKIDYFHPGSIKLAEAVRRKAADTNVMLLKNHGVLVYDISIREALARLETLEITSRMIICTKAGGIDLNSIDGSTVDDFIYHSGYKPILPRGALK